MTLMQSKLLILALALTTPLPAYAQDAFDLQAALAEGPPMTADRAASIALESSPSIERARALSRMSEAAVSRARAAMLPRLELSARYAHVDGFPDGEIAIGGDPDALAAARMLADRVSDPAARTLWLGTLEQQSGGNVTLSIPRDQIAFGARLTWPVSDLFFAMLPALESAEAGVRARELSLRASEAEVALRAREAFYQLARARGGLAVARQAHVQAEAQRARIDAAVSAGLLTEADRLSADARVAAAEQAIAMAEAGVEVADAALRAVLGADEGPVYGIGEPLEEAGEAPPSAAALISRALARRPEILALRESLGAQRAAARASDASGYPHLALFAGADYASPNRYVIPPSQDFSPSWEVGAVLSWAPNDALTAAHRGEELAAQLAASEADLAQLERAIRLEVRRSHATLAAARRSVESARAALTAAEAAYASREAQLRAGDATTADLFAAESDLNRARLALLDATIDLHLARARLAYASGS